jgi:hypothetical protein
MIASPAAVRTPTAAMATTTMLSESRLRRASEHEGCNEYKQDFGEAGFCHFNSLHRTTEGSLERRFSLYAILTRDL